MTMYCSDGVCYSMVLGAGGDADIMLSKCDYVMVESGVDTGGGEVWDCGRWEGTCVP